MADPLFRVSNAHTEPCGDPPVVDGDAEGTYFGYFANEYGEQAIYRFDQETGEASIQMGDAGWANVYRVVDGEPEGLLLTKAEAAWLMACWLATGGRTRGPRSEHASRRAGT